MGSRGPITAVSIGPREPIEDPYGTWAELREISDGGVLLVRPDLYVAARHASAPDSPETAAAWLTRTLTSVLGTEIGP
jgi:2,4-dichlorophenol 6-monooxygenase